MPLKIVQIDADKPRHLKFGSNQLAEIQEMLGGSLTALTKSPGIVELRAVLYAGLRWEDNSLTLECIGDIMDVIVDKHGSYEYISECIEKAMDRSGVSNFPSK